MTAAALIAALRPSRSADIAREDLPYEVSASDELGTMTALPETRKAVAATPRRASAAAKTPTVDASKKIAPPVESVKAIESPSEEPAPASSAVESMAATPSPSPEVAAESTSTAEVQTLPPTTITGCVELDEETFWLKNPSGAGAPTSRSWRSGFLKKRPAAIELVDSTRTLKLQNYVGQRVAATGTIMKREMRAESLRRLAASCS